MAGIGVFDSQKISASYKMHQNHGAQGAHSACRIAGRQDFGAVIRKFELQPTRSTSGKSNYWRVPPTSLAVVLLAIFLYLVRKTPVK